MRKKLLASVFVLFMLASTTPIFAANTTNTTTLTPDQLAKLNGTQTKLTNLVADIDNLLVTYKDTKQKGLLVALKQFKKDAIKLNTEIKLFIKHPTKNADKIIDRFVNKESQLEHKVNVTENILNKTKDNTNKIGNKTDNHPLDKIINKTKDNKTV